MTKKTLYDIDEERLKFINEFIIDACIQKDPEIDIEKMSKDGRLTGYTFHGDFYTYFLDSSVPILCMDINLLLNGT